MPSEAHANLVKLVRESGLLSPSATVEDIMKINGQVSGLQAKGGASSGPKTGGGVTTDLKQALIHSHFFLVYNDEA